MILRSRLTRPDLHLGLDDARSLLRHGAFLIETLPELEKIHSQVGKLGIQSVLAPFEYRDPAEQGGCALLRIDRTVRCSRKINGVDLAWGATTSAVPLHFVHPPSYAIRSI